MCVKCKCYGDYHKWIWLTNQFTSLLLLAFSQWTSFHHRKRYEWRCSVGLVLPFYNDWTKGSLIEEMLPYRWKQTAAYVHIWSVQTDMVLYYDHGSSRSISLEKGRLETQRRLKSKALVLHRSEMVMILVTWDEWNLWMFVKGNSTYLDSLYV